MALSTNRTLITQTGINTHQVLNVGGLDSAGIATFSNFKTGSTNVHSVGVEAAGINVLGGDTPIGAGATIYDDGGVRFVGVVTAGRGFAIGIQSASLDVAKNVGISTLNFIGAGNTFAVSGTTVDISIAGGGGGGSGAFTTSITGIQTTSQIVGIGTTSTDDADLQGIGNSARGMYVSNGMIIMDNLVSGNHYIGTNFNGMMVGPVNIEGTISIDGNYVVV